MNILIIARHFIPQISGGARRPMLMAQGLESIGHKVWVASPYTNDDFDAIHLFHPNAFPKTVGGDSNDVSTVFSNIKAVGRSILRWPDPDIIWAKGSVPVLVKACLEHNIDTIITSSPPESVHYIGAALKKIFSSLCWIADFRDNWLHYPLRKDRVLPHRRLGETLLARYWLSQADGIVAPSQTILKEIKRFSQGECLLLPQAVEKISIGPMPSIFESYPEAVNIAHLGSFSLSDRKRNINQTLVVFEKARSKVPKLRLFLIGRLTENETQMAKQVLGVTCMGVLSRHQALNYALHANGLLLATAKNSHATPGKLFEYGRIGKPVVIIGSGPWLQDVAVQRHDPILQLIRIGQGHAEPINIEVQTPKENAQILADFICHI